MDFRNVQLPREIHTGSGIINDIGLLCKDLIKDPDVTLLVGPTTKKVAGNTVKQLLEDEKFDVSEIIIKHATEESVEQVTTESKNTSTILSVGGGTVIDVGKMAATNNKIPLFSVPTTAAHDGIVSPRASIKNEITSVSLKVDAPYALIADTQIIADAPYKFLASGVSDIISNLTAVEDWKLAHKLIDEEYSESAALLSKMTAKLLMSEAETIRPGHVESVSLVVKGLISSGMAISIAGSSRPASGSEHKFSHALDKIAPNPALHGQQCGVGTIMMMYLQGGNWQKVRSALQCVHAATNAKDLNIEEEYIIEALLEAHNIRKERYTILGDRGLTREAAENIAIETHVIEP